MSQVEDLLAGRSQELVPEVEGLPENAQAQCHPDDVVRGDQPRNERKASGCVDRRWQFLENSKFESAGQSDQGSRSLVPSLGMKKIPVGEVLARKRTRKKQRQNAHQERNACSHLVQGYQSSF